MNDMDKMEIISVEEAAERLNIGRGSLYKLLKDRDSGIKAWREIRKRSKCHHWGNEKS